MMITSIKKNNLYHSIFIDTGAFLAKYIAKDQFHEQASKIWKSLEEAKEKIITSNFILDETFTLLARQANYDFAARIAQAIYGSEIIHIIRPTHDTELKALNLFSKYADQKISFTDCISFQLMKENHICNAFSFDKHFQWAGFTTI